MSQTGWLEQQTFIPTVLEAGESKSKVPEDLVNGESPPAGLQRAAFMLCDLIMERERSSGVSLFLKVWTPS